MIEPSPLSAPEPAPPTQTVRVALPFLAPTVTYAIIGLRCLFIFCKWLSVCLFGYAVYEIDWLEYFWRAFNYRHPRGEVWRFITPVFLHGSIPHIFFNMYALLIHRHVYGTALWARQRFVLLYFLGGVRGECVFLPFHRGERIFSGRIHGGVWVDRRGGDLLLPEPRTVSARYAKQAIGNVVFIIAINLFIGLSPGIDNWGHIGGLLGGMIFAWFARPALDGDRHAA